MLIFSFGHYWSGFGIWKKIYLKKLNSNLINEENVRSLRDLTSTHAEPNKFDQEKHVNW